MIRWVRKVLAWIAVADVAVACGGGGGDAGDGTSSLNWTCTYAVGEMLQHDLCTCSEDAAGSADAECRDVEYQCCWYLEDAPVDGGWVPRCQCMTPDHPENLDDGNDAELFCANIAADPETGDSYRNKRMVDACPP